MTLALCGLGGFANAESVARIGETEYASLQDAFDAAKKGETVALLKDVIFDELQSEPYLIITNSITLDLGEHVIMNTQPGSSFALYQSIYLGDYQPSVLLVGPRPGAPTDETPENKIDVVIKATTGGIISTQSSRCAVAAIGNPNEDYPKANVTITGGNYESAAASCIYQVIGSLTIDGGAFRSAKPRTVLNSKRYFSGNFAINGGRFYGFNPACFSVWQGADDSQLNNYYHRHDNLAAGKKTVWDSGWYTVVDAEEGYTFASQVKVKTKSLCFESVREAIRFVAEMNDVANLGKLDLQQSDEVDIKSADMAIAKGFTFVLNGCTLTLPAGYQLVEKSGAYVIQATGEVADVYVAQIGETKYKTLDEAWEAASGTVTIQLLADATLKPSCKYFSVSEGAADITIDLNTYTMTACNAANSAFGIDSILALNRDKLTIKNGTLVVDNLQGGANADLVIEDATIKGNIKPSGSLTLTSGNFSEATLVVTPSSTVTKTASLAVVAPEGYHWKNDTTLTEKKQCVVTLAPSAGGSVTVAGAATGGSFYVGSVVTLAAEEKEGYVFVGWTEDGEIISTNTVAQMTVPEKENVTIAANFVLNAVYAAIADQAVTKALENNEIVHRESIKEIAVQNPTIEVQDGVASVGIQLMKAERLQTLSLDGGITQSVWSPVTAEECSELEFDPNTQSFKFKVSAAPGAKFFKFVPAKAKID